MPEPLEIRLQCMVSRSHNREGLSPEEAIALWNANYMTWDLDYTGRTGINVIMVRCWDCVEKYGPLYNEDGTPTRDPLCMEEIERTEEEAGEADRQKADRQEKESSDEK